MFTVSKAMMSLFDQTQIVTDWECSFSLYFNLFKTNDLTLFFFLRSLNLLFIRTLFLKLKIIYFKVKQILSTVKKKWKVSVVFFPVFKLFTLIKKNSNKIKFSLYIDHIWLIINVSPLLKNPIKKAFFC